MFIDIFKNNAYHPSLARFARKSALSEGEMIVAARRARVKALLARALAGLLGIASLTTLLSSLEWTESSYGGALARALDTSAGWHPSAQGAMAAGVGFTLSLISVTAFFFYEIKREQSEALSERMDNSCARAANLVQSSPSARRWRDEAVEKGRELRGFDLDAMQAIADLEKEGALLSQRQASCLRAHGIEI